MRPRWVVCEDGEEYRRRFERFLGEEFEFVAAADAGALLAALAGGADGVILDLDFRRTPPERLIDECGTPGAAGPAQRRRLAESQGILLLRHLRARGFRQPVLLCADLEDAEQIAFLEGSLGPLAIVPSTESLLETAKRMRRG